MFIGLTELLVFLLTFIVVITAVLITYARWNYGTLETMGIPVIKPHWFLGSNPDYKELYHNWEDVRRAKKLGPVYGLYDGRAPTVFITDPEIIYKMLFPEAEYFEKREHDWGDATINDAIEFLNGPKWKAVHTLLTPQFTSGKLKMQTDIIRKISLQHSDSLKAQADSNGRVSKVDLHEFVAPFVVQIIAEVMCGIVLDDPTDPKNPFITNMRAAMGDGEDFGSFWNYIQVFPFLIKVLALTGNPLKLLMERLTAIMDSTEKSGLKPPNMVGTLIEMRKRSETDPEYKQLGITMDTVHGQAFEFFVASFVGVTATFKGLCYYLVTMPEVYKKVKEEVELINDTDYESLQRMEYLGACISEVLRIVPGFFRPERTCVKDWKHENVGNGKTPSFTLRKGTHVVFPLYALHHNPANFPDPSKFIPERFLSENKDNIPRCSYLPFGTGTRQCLGQRLVYQIIKLLTVSIIRDFELEKRDDTVWEEKPGNHMLVPLKPVFIDFVKK